MNETDAVNETPAQKLLNLFDKYVNRHSFDFSTSACLTLQTCDALGMTSTIDLSEEVGVSIDTVTKITDAYAYAPSNFPTTDYAKCREVARRILDGEAASNIFYEWSLEHPA